MSKTTERTIDEDVDAAAEVLAGRGITDRLARRGLDRALLANVASIIERRHAMRAARAAEPESDSIFRSPASWAKHFGRVLGGGVQVVSEPRAAASRTREDILANPPDAYAAGLAARGVQPSARPAGYDPHGQPPDPYAPGLEKLRREQGITTEQLRTSEAAVSDIFERRTVGVIDLDDVYSNPPDAYVAAIEARRKEQNR